MSTHNLLNPLHHKLVTSDYCHFELIYMKWNLLSQNVYFHTPPRPPDFRKWPLVLVRPQTQPPWLHLLGSHEMREFII